MPDISRIITPEGDIYDIKDAVARQATAGGITFLGITTTELYDGSTEPFILIDGSYKDAINGALAIYGTKEFIYTESDVSWHEFGDVSALGDLAYKDEASGDYTPEGTVSQPTFTGNSLTSTGSFTPTGTVEAPTISKVMSGSTTTVHNPTKQTVTTSVTAVPPAQTAPSNNLTYYAVSGEMLKLFQIGYNTGDSISVSDVTVKTGDATYEASAPNFTGDAGTISVTGTPSGTVSQPEFSGTEGTVTVS